MATSGRRTPASKRGKQTQSYDLSQYQGSGLEKVEASDILVGRLHIIQTLSPELKKKDNAYIAEAEEGMIINKASKALFDEIEFLPIAFRKEWQEWAPRKSGKGLIRIHTDEECLLGTEPNSKGIPITDDGNEIIESVRWFGLNLSSEGEPEQCFIIMQSTQLKHSRQLVTYAMNARLPDGKGGTYHPPLWGQTYKLSTRPDSNSEGDWHSWHIEVCRPLYDYCEAVGHDVEESIQGIVAVQEMAQTAMDRANQRQLGHDTDDSEQM